MVAQPLLESLELLLCLSNDSVVLHYDTVFNIGDYYHLSTSLFRHSMFIKNDPLDPVGFFLHSRHFHTDHVWFLESIRQLTPLLATKGITIVTDQEFNFSDVFPNSCHNFIHYLRSKANCKSSDISYYSNIFKELMVEPTEANFDKI